MRGVIVFKREHVKKFRVQSVDITGTSFPVTVQKHRHSHVEVIIKARKKDWECLRTNVLPDRGGRILLLRDIPGVVPKGTYSQPPEVYYDEYSFGDGAYVDPDGNIYASGGSIAGIRAGGTIRINGRAVKPQRPKKPRGVREVDLEVILKVPRRRFPPVNQ